MKHFFLFTILIAVFIIACATSEDVVKEEQTAAVEEMPMPFGGADDVAYAKTLWGKMEKGGFNSIPATLQPGNAPHGAVIEILEGKFDGKTCIF